MGMSTAGRNSHQQMSKVHTVNSEDTDGLTLQVLGYDSEVVFHGAVRRRVTGERLDVHGDGVLLEGDVHVGRPVRRLRAVVAICCLLRLRFLLYRFCVLDLCTVDFNV